MQRPAEMRWSEPRSLGDIPTRRSGHSLCAVGDFGYLFGGCDYRRPVGPSNDMYKLDMSGSEFYWSKVEFSGSKLPGARYKHTTAVLDDKIIVFGGFLDSSKRFNDVWIFDTKSGQWSQPPPGQTETLEDGTSRFKREWPNCPEPRGAHSATLIGDRMYVFGGYGGDGYARKDFNDLHVLDCYSWEWIALETTGDIPPPRSGHQAVAVGTDLYVFGGWNSVEEFDDMYVLDTELLEWTKLHEASGPSSFGAPRWNFSALSVFAVPYWKIFMFGGNSGHLLEDNNPQGTYRSDMLVYEIGRGEWSSPTVVGNCPPGRSDTDMIYDLNKGRIVLFGGWANRWFGDVHVCDVLEVVGPPYSISSISPVIGPITGNTQGSIEGMGFSSSTGNVVIRFACTKGFLETKGEVVSDEEIIFETPPFMKYGPVQVEVRVAIGGKTFTNSSAEFRYFSVTDATRSVAFGPGLLTNIPPQHPVQFIIQARDKHNFDRVCGFDEWSIQIDRVTIQETKEEEEEEEGKEEEETKEEEIEEIEPHIIDQDDGTYLVTYTPPVPGEYHISIQFEGTFEGVAGSIRGTPFTALVEEGGDPENGQVDGPVLLDYIQNKTKEIKDYCNRSIKDLKKPVGEDIVDPLLVVKSRLMDIEKNKRLLELHMDMMKSALQYLKNKKDASVDKLIDALNHVGGQNGLWVDLLRQVPLTTQTIARPTKHWTEQIRLSMDEYKEDMKKKLKEFKKLPFWLAETGYTNAIAALDEATNWLHQQRKQLEENMKLCETFEFPTYIKESEDIIHSMGQDIEKMRFLWDVTKGLDTFIASSAEMKWVDLDPEVLEDDAKVQMKATKSISTQLRWCNAYTSVDRKMKDFMNTIPLISLLLGKCMRSRHWESMHSIMKGESLDGEENETKQPEGRTLIGDDFPYPYKNKNLKLKDILDLNIHLWANEIEEICDRALKEEKIENTLVQLDERWQSISWLMETYNETDVPLLKIMEEDYECLENDQLTVQGMLASRFVKQFETEVQGWQSALANVSDIFSMLTDIQRTWSYLEPLFIHSEEVKRELPETAERFKGIDVGVRRELKRCWELKNIKIACNQENLDTTLETILEQLEICKKSLVEFLDGRRRQFPRYYFTSESDLLDILSNGSTPSRILVHIPKIYLATKTLVITDETKVSSEGRPYATSFIAGVGKEEVDFEPHVPLDGKVETYMQTVLTAMESTIFANLKRCLKRYNDMPRPEWVMCQDSTKNRPMDPAQCILLTLCINYVSEVEEAFYQMKQGSPQALSDYNKKQIDQLSDLIRLTQSNLSKGDRQRVMVCITLDTHGRDVVQKMVREEVDDISCFQWQSQLKHKYRQPPSNASHINRKMYLRGSQGERAEVAIADAIVPYDYEYLGNGPRLVITPLTDRIYVTATQALNLKMGCAPAGPAGTGKTETTKDLANSLAKCCYVFNCSPEMDYLSMGNIYKGLASSGSWGCFDEFNRLIPEVLSVCSVQFKAVCDGVKADNERIMIEGDDISLDPTVGVFITMNPGYLGRSELPEGLKALFRPITVMVPDLVLICENMLMAEGFVGAKELASKFYGLYSLLKELLSKAPHYDWGLRAVKSVLVVAGGFKRAEPDIPEDVLLMRALRDFNIPKIVKEDEVVFFGLLGDLFPGLDPPRKTDEELESLVKQSCVDQKLWPDETFQLKVVQLKELLEIRHCVFVMGPPGAGKTSCWKTLCGAQGLRGEKTKYLDINPKSITTHELYGNISLATREWRDGLLSKVMRDFGLIPDEKPKWIVLDGDLDANWIESMNSVMDDNRMLTLASNERIPLKAHMKMLFEIRDLRFASPATVSRAGILYISTDDGTQWKSLIHSWVDQRESSQETKDLLTELFDRYVFETLRWLKKNAKPVVYLEDMNLVTSLLYMLDATFQDSRIVNDLESIPKAFVYCMIWSMGSALTIADDGTDYKKMFSDWWRSEWRDVKIPTQYTVFDYWYDVENKAFDLWSKSPYLSEISFDSKTMSMNAITVATPETCSVSYWMGQLVDMKRPIMLCGPSGTGKTQLVNGLIHSLDSSSIFDQNINFNFYTTASILQKTMSIPLVKKTGTNFGPPGQKRLIYFVDDLNLPELDPYDTQSAIALLRQYMEYEHVYDMNKLQAKNIMNTQVISCMNPTAGSFEINPRLQRWFVTIAIGMPETMSLHTIYLTFLNGHLQHFNEEVGNVGGDLVKGAVNLHREVMANFRKTASNFHYEFNIRHLANVFQGILVSKPTVFDSAEKFISLWLHESERVYGDRLVSLEDLQKYNKIVQTQCKRVFPSFDTTRFYSEENADPLVFCHFPENIQDKEYDQVDDMEKMSNILNDALAEYNDMNAVMDLVLFEDAMKHIARIVRIIMNPGGHALLVGVGGSGKQSLSRLSAFICGFNVMQIVISGTYGINDLKDDLKLMFQKAGVKDEGVMFLLTDSQITNERFLIFINDLLASGNIPDLFAADEIDEIANACASKVKELGLTPDKEVCWDYFLRKVKENLHVVLAFSPVGDDFRTRARKFPALVNCTVIDWFQPWPKEALYSVGKKYLASVEFSSEEERDVIERFLPYSFDEVNKAAKRFLRVERRFVYTTPKSFLELLKLYGVLLEKKRSEADQAIDRLNNGLQKLRETSEAVAELEATLKIALEEAEEKKIVAEGIAETVSQEKAIVEVETKKAQIENDQVTKIQEEVSAKQRDTEEDLAKAIPAVEAAMSALDTLDKRELSECKTMVKPPAGVDDIFSATMVLLANIHPNIVVQKNGKVKDRSWGAAKKQLLSNVPAYLESLKGLKEKIDSGEVPSINWREIRPYLELEHFDPVTIQSKNPAAAGLCTFILNIVAYNEIVTTVEPKRQALAEANAELESANERLRIVMEKVSELEEKLAKLTVELNKANKEKQDALDSVERGQTKLDLAQRLTTALSAENERWAENVAQMEADKMLLTGDVLLASAFISYIGPFTKPFRDYLLSDIFVVWLNTQFKEKLGEEGMIPMSSEANPVKILTNPAEVALWNEDGLPADKVSTENGAIVENSARWPLMIDPQLQGIAWVRNKEGDEDRHLEIVRLGQKDLLRKLERALENGYTILIENIGESIDAVLYPVIQRATIKRGRTFYVKLGDSEVEMNPNFKLYLHTKLSNPHYPPEIQAETTLVNFTVTMAGLEDQLLSLVVRKERADLAQLREDLVKQQNSFKIKMKELEDNILYKLATAEGDITEDVELIEGLEETKRVSIDIAHKAEVATETQRNIEIVSEKYRPVANRSSLLFFLMNELVKSHSYYIYSLAAFTDVFYRGIDKVTEEKKEEEEELEEKEEDEEDDSNTISDDDMFARCTELIDSITITVFNYIRRGLFEKDKLMVAVLLTIKILVNDEHLTTEEVEYLIGGKLSLDPGNMGPLGEWMPEAIWPKVKALEGLKVFQRLGDTMQQDSDDWQVWFDHETPETAKLPGDYEKTTSDFYKLILVRVMRPDRITTALRAWVSKVMGEEYVFQKPFNMADTFNESSTSTPIFFVLFPGVDPTPWVEGLGKKMGISYDHGNFSNISMGQGQEAPAEAIIEKYSKEGGWVMLQNCHLMQTWVPKLERLLEIASESAHENFRCFVSAEPPPLPSMKNMPESLMQSCIKIANQAPTDIKSNLTRGWAAFDQERFDHCAKESEFKGCLFGLCWFHSVIVARRRFGFQGWSRPYSFNMGDLTISADVLESYLITNDVIPWDDLRYIFGEIMYGGHITDAWDRRTNSTYLSVLFNEGLFTEKELAPSFVSPNPSTLDYQGYLDYVDSSLPAEAPPQFGLHPNAEIGYLTTSAEDLFRYVLILGGANSSKAGGIGSDDKVEAKNPVKELMDQLLADLPEDFDMITIGEKAEPLLHEQTAPFVVVAIQECTRMNTLMSEIRRSLIELDKGMKGQLNISQGMEDLSAALEINEWPGRDPLSLCRWEQLAWPSRKRLQNEFLDMLARVRQLKEWTENMETPISVWLSGLFNPTAYLTAIMQVTSRKNNLPLDKMTIETHVSMYQTPDKTNEVGYPSDGMYVHGLYLEGARWPSPDEIEETKDIDGVPCGGSLIDGRLKELLPALPVVYIKAVPVQSTWEPSSVGYLRHVDSIYECPVYITSMRGGTYVFLSTLETNEPKSKWVLTGTAILMQTDD